ncbi:MULTISPECIES: GNAT family N-acetyltransferase [Eubacteriales]|uniref:GNAT family N-acetyltransferase n=1 Tax=Eubacteriales TaxID=186802 RepID=UPI001EFFF126|nr:MULTISPECIES: GNAT family N-acetyltransferase [Eubacteriales]MCF6466626.1 GNAT family N-acetyltransferase [Clostridium sp. Cult2]WIV12802.1 GNAT family N-acetyltransferase [Proteiniborus sp. MB09-C3]
MELIVPCKKYYSSYIDAIKEFSEYKVDTYQFLDASKYDIFEKIENFKTGKNLPLNYVKATYLWLVEDDEFIGEVSIRHELTDSLLCFGGNIGYGIRYSKWNKGYGTIMLSLALKHAKEVVGLNKVLITCNDNNLGSARVIEKNFGLLQDKIINVIDGVERITRRYWIEIN